MARKIIFAAVIFAAVFFAGCVSQAQKGVLQGHVTIGPLCPVEPCNITQEQIEKAYEARKIFIYGANRQLVLEEVSIDKNGNYGVELNAGNYVVDIPRTGVGGSKDLPAQIKIEAGKTTTLDIDIDTGIR